MAYEQVERQARGDSSEERVSVSANGRTFLVSSATMKKSFGGAEKVLIFIDKNAAGNEVKIGFLPTNEDRSDAYAVVRPRRSKSGYIMAKSALGKLGYSHNKLYPRQVEWVERPINGKKIGILEFGIERKYLK